jgi:diketogulonate reductase-like aldo/keto reductase
MGESRSNRKAEVSALQAGLDLGLTVIDTAEMYANGAAEEVTAEAIKGRRGEVFLVSKVLPSNASREGVISACEASLRRLQTDHLDLYLLHWRGGTPLRETVEAFEKLKADGKIASWGVSNFDASDMDELASVADGKNCLANQVLYHAASRGIEFDLLPRCQKIGVVVMAYCPLGQGSLLGHQAITAIARKHGVADSAVVLAWLLARPGVMAIPKSAHVGRVKEFAKARDIKLDAEDFAAIGQQFPAPRRKTSLDMS